MSIHLKRIFATAVLAVGGGVGIIGLTGLLVGGWSTANDPSGVNLTTPVLFMTALCIGAAVWGYSALKASFENKPQPNF